LLYRYTSGAAVELRLGAVTACVAADAFFAEAERQPAFGALAQLVPAAANNVVVLPTGAAAATAADTANGGGAANAEHDGSVAAPTAAELMTDATAWVRSLAAAGLCTG
jgi:hypothetical protein